MSEVGKFWDIVGVQGPGLVAPQLASILAEIWDSLEKFCQQNKASCLCRQDFYHSVDKTVRILIPLINWENRAFLTRT